MKYKGFSIITNFGCDVGCDYCIWKNHKLHNIFTSFENMDWKKLEKYLSIFPQNKISISGGGDPLFNLDQNLSWYIKLMAICDNYNKKIDIHTAKILEKNDMYKLFSKYVLHLNYKRFLEYKDILEDFPLPFRLTFVLTRDWTVLKIKEVMQFAKQLDCQLSFRELYGQHFIWDKGLREAFEYLEEQELLTKRKIRYVKNKDYNTYMMPNNYIYTDFMCYNDPIF